MRPTPRAFLRILRNAAIDLQVGGRFLGGSIPDRHAHRGAYLTANSDYAALDWIFAQVSVAPDDVLVDVGSGKGRVLQWWLYRGLRNRMIGVELDGEVASAAARRLSRYPNVEIVAGDVLERFPGDASLVFMANPFDLRMMRAFKRLLTRRYFGRRALRVVYHNCNFVEVFQADDRWQVEICQPPRPRPGFNRLALMTLRHSENSSRPVFPCPGRQRR